MAGFLYYLPGRDQSTKLEDVRAAGLAYAFDDQVSVRPCVRGPDGAAGVVAALSDRGIGYFPSKQDWRQIPGSDAWVGMYRDERPGPADLARRDMLDGEWVELEDGQSWLVPQARRWIIEEEQVRPQITLPRLLTRDADGQWWLGDVKRMYRTLWQQACQYEQAAMHAAADKSVSGQWSFTFPVYDLAIMALQANYRVSAIEMCDLLGVFDDLACRRIIDVLLDNATFEAWIKKKRTAQALDGGSIYSGPGRAMPDESVAIDPPSQNCGRMPAAST